MRLFEVANSFADDFTEILRNLRDRNDSQGADSSNPIPWASLNGLLGPMGYGEVGERAMAGLVQQYPALNNIVKTFDKEGITLASDEESDDNPQTPIPTGPSVDDMAKSGAQDFQNKLS
jgi:hypothetical protein